MNKNEDEYEDELVEFEYDTADILKPVTCEEYVSYQLLQLQSEYDFMKISGDINLDKANSLSAIINFFLALINSDIKYFDHEPNVINFASL